MGGHDDRLRVPARIGNWILEQNLGAGYSGKSDFLRGILQSYVTQWTIGSIWKATNPFTGQTAAVKVQDVAHECPTNRYERNFYPSLQGGKGMPTLWAAGIQQDYDYLGTYVFRTKLDFTLTSRTVIDLLGYCFYCYKSSLFSQKITALHLTPYTGRTERKWT
jgi:hypothetical protein